MMEKNKTLNILKLYKQCDKLSTRLSELSFMLSEKGEFSPEVDRLINEYDHSIEFVYENEAPDFDKIISILENFIQKSENVIERYIKGSLETKQTIKRKLLQLDRKKKISKAKPKRKVCKCKK